MLYEGWHDRRQYEYDHTRFLAWTINATSISPIKAWKKPSDVMPLPEIDGHQRQSRVRTTIEEMEAMRQRLSKELGRELHFVKTPIAE